MSIFEAGRYATDPESAPPIPPAADDDAEARFARGAAYLAMAEWGQALADFRAVQSLQPAFARAVLGEAVARMYLNELPRAVELCRSLVGSDDLELLLELAPMLAALVGPEAAIEVYERAVELAPENIETLYAAGLAQATDGDPFRARRHFEEIIPLCDPLEQYGLFDQVVRFLQSLPKPPAEGNGSHV